jgi:hypothetical protein
MADPPQLRCRFTVTRGPFPKLNVLYCPFSALTPSGRERLHFQLGIQFALTRVIEGQT